MRSGCNINPVSEFYETLPNAVLASDMDRGNGVCRHLVNSATAAEPFLSLTTPKIVEEALERSENTESGPTLIVNVLLPFSIMPYLCLTHEEE